MITTLERKVRDLVKGSRPVEVPESVMSFDMVLTENQQKVIKDKYLRDDNDPKEWLWRVAENIALSNLLYCPEFKKTILKDVNHKITNVDTGGSETELLLLHEGIPKPEFEKNHRRFVNNLYELFDTNPDAKAIVQPIAEQYFRMMASVNFLPNSPTLMNAGRELQQLSGCYVLPIEDSISGWGATVANTMDIHKSGGGTGFSACRVRPKGDAVKSTNGVASGAISPLKIINHTTEEIKQGGTRRGANMGILPYWHPDIFDFINAKSTEGKLENFNISVAVDEKFMRAVKEDLTYELINPKNNEAVRTVKAREVYDLICTNAWKTGDPGVIFLDRVNDSFSNPVPAKGQIEATNPCGEVPLLPYESCNLGSIHIGKFINGGKIDWNGLEDCVRLATRFLDNVIDMNNYPMKEIERESKENRRIGLGVMGLAEFLALSNTAYDSNEGLELSEKVMKFIDEKCLDESERIANERGAFPAYKDSIYDPDGKYYWPTAKGKPRNCARTTIAPTGTIGVAAGVQGGGIEPFFAIGYVRFNAKALDAIDKKEKPDDKDVFYEANPIFEMVAKEHKYFGMSKEELYKKIANNHTSVRGIKEIPEDIQRTFASAHDIPIEWHVRQQAAFQKYTNNGVSKTINLPNSATIEDVKNTYMLAYDLGCKGITVYRDGCRSKQVLNTGEKKTEEGKLIDEISKLRTELGYKPGQRPKMLPGYTIKQRSSVKMPGDRIEPYNIYHTVTFSEGEERELFGNANMHRNPDKLVDLCMQGLNVSRRLALGDTVENVIADYEGITTSTQGYAPDKGYINQSEHDALASSLAKRGLKFTEEEIKSVRKTMLEQELVFLRAEKRFWDRKQAQIDSLSEDTKRYTNGNGQTREECPECREPIIARIPSTRSCGYYEPCKHTYGNCS